MSDRPRLSTPRLRVVMDDGAEFTAQALNVDLLAWDRERARAGWAPAQDAPIVWLNYLAWSALRREGSLPRELSLREFESKALEVTAQDDEPVNPMRTDREDD